MKKKYNGLLGKFIYDSNHFAIQDGLLIYIGSATDGREIKIPRGIKCCKAMFAGYTDLKIPPAIPDGVMDLSYAFAGCKNLEESPVIPESAETIAHMLEGCISLTFAPKIPVGVESYTDVFKGCDEYIEMSGGYNLSYRGLRYEDENDLVHYVGELGDFSYDPHLFELRTNSASIEHLYYIGDAIDVFNLKIPEGLVSCKDMFRGRRDLISAPVVPHGVQITTNMFSGCHPSVVKYGEANIAERGIQHSVETIVDLTEKCLRTKISDDGAEILQVRVSVPKDQYEKGCVYVLAQPEDLHRNGKGDLDSLVFQPGQMRELFFYRDGRTSRMKMKMHDLVELHDEVLSEYDRIIEDAVRKANGIPDSNIVDDVPESYVRSL